MAKEYIEREAALNASKIVYIEYIEVDGEGYEEGNADNIPVVFKKDIEAIPAADVAPVVRGRWVHGEYGPYCSNCDSYPPTRKRYGHPGDTEFDYTKFCPNCGAKMDGGQDDA